MVPVNALYLSKNVFMWHVPTLSERLQYNVCKEEESRDLLKKVNKRLVKAKLVLYSNKHIYLVHNAEDNASRSYFELVVVILPLRE